MISGGKAPDPVCWSMVVEILLSNTKGIARPKWRLFFADYSQKGKSPCLRIAETPPILHRVFGKINPIFAGMLP